MSVNLPSAPNYAYDFNGNLTSDSALGYDYDDENQLIRLTLTNVWKSEFTYDGRQRLRVRKEYLWKNSAWAQSDETRFLYDDMLVIEERDGNNAPRVIYTRGRDLSGERQRAGGIGGLLARTDYSLLLAGLSSAHSYYHADGNGNITALLDDKQRFVAKHSYDPYGNLLSQSGPLADANVYRFSSKQFHQASALSYYGYRWYSPGTQRWLNRDPIGESGGLNLHSFVRNAPTDIVDPHGLDTYVITFSGNPTIPHTAVQIQNGSINWIYTFDPINNLQRFSPDDFWKQRSSEQPFRIDRLDPDKVNDDQVNSFYDNQLNQGIRYLKDGYVCITQARAAISAGAPDYSFGFGSGTPGGLENDLLKQGIAKPFLDYIPSPRVSGPLNYSFQNGGAY